MSAKPSREDVQAVPRSLFSMLPNIYVLRPPQGKHSRKTDERCFIYCAQSVVGRVNRQTPRCRSLCLRKVFVHEVYKAVAVREAEGRREVIPVKAQIPLPQEGQDPAAFFWPVGDDDDEGAGAGTGKGREARCWDAGWYLWYSRNPWAARERINVMAMPLPVQATWEAHKKGANVKRAKGAGAGALGQDEARWSHVGPGMTRGGPLFPDLVGETVLFPVELPSFEPMQRMLTNVLAPAGRTLALVADTAKSGAFLQFSARWWEKATGPEPWTLARNSIEKAREVLKSWADEGDEDDKRKGL
ncbi:hypothetical protein GLOTRDRAFT_41709 [Gloeophyllum trabeum ATCC 11539]|uniref:Uncharacterized protein n=1 Tax=Gloeophyllum trabeum (strain ATCC 11539 / FP-39264 / Madison 617) TaxID=670483 RepID=S7Q4U9_GLOTA|nr:uncharacterized protein GLOTRDRAFT_41709 [Gloeophyllum trabeum ATCC 11539]EPQ55041.1 hypothetical protein GLOTRDRAFT_41709 [Gloeophyllum trabeum ATCC 11539]